MPAIGPRSYSVAVPTPVGPLGPEEIDPNDPDYWDWDTPAEAPLRLQRSPWIRITAGVAVIVLVAFVIASFR